MAETMTDEQRNELARRLAAAYISCSMGLSLSHTLKTHIVETPGLYWQKLAMQVDEQQAQALKERQDELARLMAEKRVIQ